MKLKNSIGISFLISFIVSFALWGLYVSKDKSFSGRSYSTQPLLYTLRNIFKWLIAPFTSYEAPYYWGKKINNEYSDLIKANFFYWFIATSIIIVSITLFINSTVN